MYIVTLYNYIFDSKPNFEILSLIDDIYDANEFYSKMNGKYFGNISNKEMCELFDIYFINYITYLNIKTDELLCKYIISHETNSFSIFMFDNYKIILVYYNKSNSIRIVKDEINIFSNSDATQLIRSYKLHIISQTNFTSL